MATDPTDPPADPLVPFTKLGPSVYISDPKDTTTQDGRPLIFMAFWMNAPPRALAKYVVEYRRMVPSARIVFIRSSSSDFFFRSTAKAQQAQLAPAVAALRSSVTPETPVFMHLFSNGGLFGTVHLLKAYHQATGKPLPISSMIIDSAPGTASISGAMKAFSYALPKLWIFRLVGTTALWITLVLIKIYHAITGSLDAVNLARKTINDTSLVQPATAKGVLTRCYIYSDGDELVDWRDVEKHASESEASGWKVRREKFQGTPHVGHMRAQPERYWSIVKEYLDLAKAAS
ncbi:Transmembrane protein 53 [Penicillium rolfsii]|nr:Transmembrane protein 53 [Penicillium rolfsii]